MQLLLLSLAAVLFAVGGIFMKWSSGMTRLAPSTAFLALFCAGASLQSIAMKRADMGVVYIFVLGLEAVAALALSVWLLGERLSVARICAVALILSGIVLLRRS